MSEYEVGYKKPPKENRFKPGKSGNPKGRPKGYQHIKTDLLDELQEPIMITEGGQPRKISKQRAFIKQLTAKAIKGEQASSRLLVTLMQKHMPELAEDDISSEFSTREDRELLEHFLKTGGNL